MARRSIVDLQKQKTKIIATTAYDAAFARLVDPWVDLVLVGDSLGMVVQGKENTLDVSLDEMIYHTQAVSRGLKQAHLVSDLPFLSYQISENEAVKHAGKLLQAGAQSVKLEGGAEFAPLVKRLVEIGIPVLGHI